MLILEIRFFCCLFLFLFFFFFLIFSFSIFLNVKNGRTPLFIASQVGYEQIVQILLEKGANVDLPMKVLLLILFPFFFFFFFFSFSFF